MKKLTGFPRILCASGARGMTRLLSILLLGAPLSAQPGTPSDSSPSGPDFNRVIRPILSENCYKCHGPDDGARKSNLRFDVRAEALRPAKSGRLAIVPGVPEKSEMVARITATDPEKRMPPVSTGKKLSTAQIEGLKDWIGTGAHYAVHWAYVKPLRPELPHVRDQNWPRNPIDHFILARLETEGMKPAPAADRATLIRRVSLDLTGLPPAPEEADAFAKDQDPQAYEKVIDALLGREAFGEHWARMWLDLARYADSAGYADDPPRNIWAYRDYVIRSFNANKPFDRFTIEQIAGDLLPDPTDEDRAATAFHRNTMTNNEGGTDDEEFRNAAVVDRVNTTMSVWMGTSMGCAQCHHHKYDPFSQEEYFQLFAIFNNTEDADRSDETPVKRLYTPAQKQQLSQAEAQSWKLDQQFRTATPQLQSGQDHWEKEYPWQLLWQFALEASHRPLTDAEAAAQYSNPPESILRLLAAPAAERNDFQQTTLGNWYRRHAAPELRAEQSHYAQLQREIAEVAPNTVPVMRELPQEKRRRTRVQLRGNFLALGDEVSPAVPAVFRPLPQDAAPDRLA
ncbi:MAG TPA: DUF1549 domain-containing protein, partial [Verrucomicrobiae bacterium]|nr:DUF1549 domain-containing protein [Verrucomicrobiae bacterium]